MAVVPITLDERRKHQLLNTRVYSKITRGVQVERKIEAKYKGGPRWGPRWGPTWSQMTVRSPTSYYKNELLVQLYGSYRDVRNVANTG